MRSLNWHGTLKFQICWNPSNTTLVFKTLLLIASWIEESLQQLWPFQIRQKGCEKLTSKPLFDVFLPWEQTWDLETLSSKSLSTSDGHFHQACLVEVRICSVVARKSGQETGSQTFVTDSSICWWKNCPSLSPLERELLWHLWDWLWSWCNLAEITLWELYCSGNTCQRLRIFQFLKETSTQKKRLKTQNSSFEKKHGHIYCRQVLWIWFCHIIMFWWHAVKSCSFPDSLLWGSWGFSWAAAESSLGFREE
jgi:hypothetical protein